MTTLLVLGLLLALRTPLFAVIGVAALLLFAQYVEGYGTLESLQVMSAKITALTTKNVLLAIPFFVVSGAIMSAGGMARRLVRVAEVLVGHFRGGLAIASVLACMAFAALSGSSPVTLIAVGSIMFPAMLKAGYKENFALGLITSAGSLGCLIPPSIPMLVYAISVSGAAAVNVGELFLAGLFPAFTIAGMLAVYSYFRSGQPPDRALPRPSFATVATAFREGFWALLMPVIILGGISTVFTPTEGSAVAVAYAVFVEMVLYRELKWSDLGPAVIKSLTLMGALLLIIVLSFGLNDFMVEKQVAEAVLAWIQARNLGAFEFLLVINVFLIVTGALMDSISAIVLFTPLIAPTAVALGIDPLHLDILFIVNMEIGYVAPPIATNLFVSAQLFRKPFGQVVRAVMPTLGILCIGLVLVTYVPTLSIGPIYAAKGKGFYQPFGGFKPDRGAPRPTSPDTAAPDTGETGHVLSVQELMRKRSAQEDAAADAGTAAP